MWAKIHETNFLQIFSLIFSPRFANLPTFLFLSDSEFNVVAIARGKELQIHCSPARALPGVQPVVYTFNHGLVRIFLPESSANTSSVSFLTCLFP